MYKLKPGVEDFDVMSGPDEGKKYAKGKTYGQVPAGFEARFEQESGKTIPEINPIAKKQANQSRDRKKADVGRDSNPDETISDKKSGIQTESPDIENG